MVGFALFVAFYLAVEMSSVSYAIMVSVRQFQVAEDPSGTKLCALDAPSTSLSLNSALDCALECQGYSYCENFNYNNANKTCEIFFYRPQCYSHSSPCIHYQVQPDQFDTRDIRTGICSSTLIDSGTRYACVLNTIDDICNEDCLAAKQTLYFCQDKLPDRVGTSWVKSYVCQFDGFKMICSQNNAK